MQYKRLLSVVILVVAMLMGGGVWAEDIVLDWYTCCNVPEKQAFFDELAKEYSEITPGVEVRKTYPGGNYGDNISTQFAGGSGPDVMFMGQSIFAFEGFAYPMNDLLAREKNLSQVPPVLSHLVTYQGKVLGMPYGANTGAMFYNKDIFDRFGVGYPTANWTFDDLLSAGKRLTADTSGDGELDYYGLGRMLPGENWWWAYTWGGDFFTPDGKKSRIANPVSIAATQWYVDHYNNKHGIYPQNGATTFNGRVAIDNLQVYQVPQMKGAASFDWDLQLLPKFVHDGKAYANTYVSGEYWMVNKFSDNLDATLDFVLWLMSPSVMRRMAEVGFVVPAHREIAAQFYTMEAPPSNVMALIQGMEYAKMFHYNHPIGSQMMSWTWGQQPWQAMWAGNLPASQALPEMENGYNALLDEFYARK